MLEAAMTVNDVDVSFGVHRTTVWRLAQRYRTTGTVKDRPRSGRPKRLTPKRTFHQDHSRSWLFLNTSSKDCWQSTESNWSPYNAQTVRNTLKACRFKSRRPPKGVDLTVHHKRQRHAWVNQHMRRNRRAVLFSDGSRFTLKFAIDRMCVWRRPGERFAEICFIPVDRFGGGSLIVWPVWRNALRRKDQLAWDKTNTECTALLWWHLRSLLWLD
jgi:hypothetical protein